MTIEERFRRLALLMRLHRELGGGRNERAEEDVRRRWNRLREICGG
jgi:hypothetical protein